MFYMEIENLGTGSKGHIYADTKKEMHDVLIKKGFTCMIEGSLYATNDSKGNEISVQDLFGTPVEAVREFTNA